jgi:hypothetical protein
MAYHWLHPVDLGHLSGATDETCRQGQNPVDILRIILDHVNQAAPQDVRYRDICVTYAGREVDRTLAESTHFARKVLAFNSRFNVPDLAAALRSKISCHKLKGCTVKPYSLTTNISEIFYQQSIKNLTFIGNTFHTSMEPESIDVTCLPNLTRVGAMLPWLPYTPGHRFASVSRSRGPSSPLADQCQASGDGSSKEIHHYINLALRRLRSARSA